MNTRWIHVRTKHSKLAKVKTCSCSLLSPVCYHYLQYKYYKLLHDLCYLNYIKLHPLRFITAIKLTANDSYLSPLISLVSDGICQHCFKGPIISQL